LNFTDCNVASVAGVDVATLEPQFEILPPHGFVYWNQRTRLVTACAPLTL
jgi:hypothetical protein